jgi:hypothetical protein
MTAIGRCPAPQNRDRRTGYCQSGIGTSPIYAKDRSNALSDTERQVDTSVATGLQAL